MKPNKMCLIIECDFNIQDEKIFEDWKKTECFGETNCCQGDDHYWDCWKRRGK